MNSISDITAKITHAELNLQRKLEWIARYDTRIVFVAGTSVAMLGVLANASGLMTCWTDGSLIVFLLAFILLGASLVCVYYSQNPSISAPNQSLLYFGTIGKMKTAEFMSKFKNSTEEEYLDDLLHQVHINSIILCKKFSNLKLALGMIAAALIPWIIAICLSKMYLH